MAKTVTFKFRNAKQMAKAFRQAPEFAKKIYGNTIRAATIATFSKRNKFVPRDTGQLRATMQFSVDSRKIRGKIFPTKDYSIYVHEGTRPHTIRVRNKKVLANKRTGEFFGKQVNHPGTKPNPFLEKMMKASKNEVNQLFKLANNLIFSKISKRSK